MIHGYSRTQAYVTCPRKFKLEYLDKVPRDGAPSADLEFGTAMHAALEASLSGGNAPQTFQVYWDFVKDAGLDYGRSNWEQLKSNGDILINRFERLYRKRFKPLALERRMHLTYAGVQFEGTPDFVGEVDGEMTLVDYKTSGYRYPRERIVVNEQMQLYSLLAEKTLGVEIKQLTYLVFIKGNTPGIQELTMQVDQEMRTRALDNLALLCHRIESDREFPQHKQNCIIGTRVCPYFKRCHGG